MRIVPFLFLCSLITTGTVGFCFPVSKTNHASRVHKNHHRHDQSNSQPLSLVMDASNLSNAIMGIRGGGADVVVSVLQNGGSLGIVSLWAIASAVVIPLTMIRQGYSFSVGYGYSVMAMGLACFFAFRDTFVVGATSPQCFLVTSVILYGFRLGSFLVLRNAIVQSKNKQIKSFDKSPRWKRIPLALNVSLLYAFMTSPVMFALQQPTPLSSSSLLFVTWMGTCMAWIGAILEAIADGQKFLAKTNVMNTEKEATTFVGPTKGLYTWCRHPNYFGEVVFWVGLFLGGIPSYGYRPIPWIATTLGLVGILFIMKSATQRLDQKQTNLYSGQQTYDTWKQTVSASWIPFRND